MKAAAHLLGALLAAACAALPAAQAQTLVRGHPPLTQAMVDRVTGLMGELLGLTFAPEHGERLRATYVGAWRGGRGERSSGARTHGVRAAAGSDAVPWAIGCGSRWRGTMLIAGAIGWRRMGARAPAR